MSGKSTTDTVYVAYDPSDPDKMTLCYSPLKAAWHMVLSLGLLLLGLGVMALVVHVTGEILLDG